LQTRLEDFDKQDAVVMAIAVDLPEDSREMVKDYDLAFLVLSDTEATTARDYGVLHKKAHPFDETDIARPATFILDRQGRVVWHHLPENWRIRPRPDELLDELAKIP